ncbi:hypothetical protein RchiOBHm_Chr6g0277631 [Rosa chinensis]|uniref:Uncharacterized protein n=1 Tax=Rosa chinensis TaxID=74649 RepID=A0A2P6PSL7_ROSCH|nr:hypothetical protein RchiOBHm_Chr6g0277631 [Rosa chinensis]
MRYFEEYLNEFQEYYCTIGELENTDLVNLLHRKLPEPWRTAVRESIAEKPIERFSVGGIADRIRQLLKEQCKANLRAKMAKKQLKGVENFCYGILDMPTNWGCHESKFHRKKKLKRKILL